MDPYLQPGLVRGKHVLRGLWYLIRREASRIRCIEIWIEKPRCRRTQASVRISLKTSDPEHRVPECIMQTSVLPAFVIGKRRTSIHASFQCASSKQLLVNSDVRSSRHILHARHAKRRRVVGRSLRRLKPFLERRIRNYFSYVTHRSVFENARWIGIRIAHYLPAFDVLRIFINTRKLHRKAVRERHVAVKPVDKDWIVGRRGIDQLSGRKTVGRPVFVVPFPAQYPTTFRQLCRKRANSLDKFLRRFRGSQIDG